MGSKTSIGWTDASWNAMRGCSRTIAKGADTSGCGDPTGGGCYAERNGYRFHGPGLPYEGLVRMTPKGARWTGKVSLVDEKLLDPLRWTEPRMIFTTSVSDPFHERFTNETIAILHGVMAITHWHRHQCLTKRAGRMRTWNDWLRAESAAANDGKGMTPAAYCFTMLQRYVNHDPHGSFSDHDRKRLSKGDVVDRGLSAAWPLPNLWKGVSCEHQLAADERVIELMLTEAAVRFVSLEPLIGGIDMTNVRIADGLVGVDALAGLGPSHVVPRAALSPIDWVIVGCESGPKSRPMDAQWVRVLRDQCAANGRAFFLKQAVESPDFAIGELTDRKGAAGNLLDLPYIDGKAHAAFPEAAYG